MIEVNEPQIWTLIGIFAASMLGMLRMVSASFINVLRAEIGGLGGEINGLRGEMNARFDQLNGRVDHLDRDVQTLFRRVFPEYPEAN